MTNSAAGTPPSTPLRGGSNASNTKAAGTGCPHGRGGGTLSETKKKTKGNRPPAPGLVPDEKGENAGAYPLYLIPQVLSREIHARGGTITAIVIRRSGRHNYQITIADAAKTV